jgi:hypothetical protein
MTAMLMIMSGIYPHTIRVTWVGMVEMLGVGQSCGMFDVVSRGEELLNLVVEAFGYRIQPLLSTSQTTVSLPCLKPSCHLFPHLLNSNHKPTQACLSLPLMKPHDGAPDG